MTRTRRHYHNRLRKYRRMMGYSQKQVAWLLGHKSTASLSRWEKGLAMPSVENLLRLGYLYRTLCDQLYHDLTIEFRQSLYDKEIKLVKKSTDVPNGP